MASKEDVELAEALYKLQQHVIGINKRLEVVEKLVLPVKPVPPEHVRQPVLFKEQDNGEGD
jgi:hypothetical protein